MAGQLIQLPPGPRGKLISNFLKYGGLLVTGFLVAPFVYTAIGGLIGLAAAAVLYVLITAMAPVVSMKISNLATRFLIQEIRQNPVEARINLSRESWKKLGELEGILNEFRRMIKQYIVDTKPAMKNPVKAEEINQRIGVYNRLLEVKIAAWSDSRAKLKEFDRVTEEEVKPEWAATLAGDKMNKAAKALKIDTALFNLINSETVSASTAGAANSLADLEHALAINSIEQLQDSKFSGQVPTLTLERDADGLFVLPNMGVKSPVMASI